MRRRILPILGLISIGFWPDPGWTGSSGFRVVPMDGKGFGVVAEKTFDAGDLVYQEAPLIMWNVEDATKTQLLNLVAAIAVLLSVFLLVAFNAVGFTPLPLAAAAAFALRRRELGMPEELQEQYEQLSSEEQDQIKGLSDCSSGEKTMMGILRTNGFSRGASSSSSTLLLCPVLARLNHSCSPNCQQSWDEESGQEKLYAMTKIQPGEELCITYCDLREPRDKRREVLRAKYGFLCSCPACCHTDIETSDARRTEIARLQENLAAAQPADGVEMAKRVLQLLDDEGVPDLTLRGLACTEAVRHCETLSDPQQARSWAEKAYDFFSKARGPTSEIAQDAKALAKVERTKSEAS